MNKLLFRFLSFSSAKFICCSTDHYVQAQAQPFIDNKNNIYDGIEASPEEYPFQVALVNSSLSTSSSNQSQIVCGGSLIAPNYVLTAAQCSNKATSVQISRHDGDNSTTLLFEEIEIENEIVHPYYSYPFYDEDNIMVVKLKSNSTMQTDEFMQYGFRPEEGEVGTILGWASNSNDIDGLNQSDVLMKKQVHIMSTANCSEAFGGNISYSTIYDMICASALPNGEGGQGFCEGDYGGPLMKGGSEYKVQVGIISYGKDMTCSDEDSYPGLYTRVEKHRDFISCVVNGGTEECGLDNSFSEDYDYYYPWDDDWSGMYPYWFGYLAWIFMCCTIVCFPIGIPFWFWFFFFVARSKGRINVDARLFEILKEPVDISYDEIMQYLYSLIPYL